MTRDGCHDKKGKPVNDDSLGLYCNCCKYRVTSRPRSKFYNEQYKNFKETKSHTKKDSKTDARDLQKNPVSNAKPNPKKIEAIKNISPELLKLMNNFSKTAKDFAKKITNSESFEIENSVAYGIFYKLFQNPSLTELLYDVYRISRLHNKIPKFWSDYVDEGGIYGVDRFENMFSTYSEMEKYLNYSLYDEICIIYDYGKKTQNLKQDSSSKDPNSVIEKLAKELIERYHDAEKKIDRNFKLELINKYREIKSVKKICKLYPQSTQDEIRFSLRTPIRLPTPVQTLLHDGSITPNPESALSIALFATDYYHWDGEVSIADRVSELVKKLSNYFQKNPALNQSLMGKKLPNEDKK